MIDQKVKNALRITLEKSEKTRSHASLSLIGPMVLTKGKIDWSQKRFQNNRL